METSILKQATAELHTRVERQLNLMREDLTRAEYRAILLRFWGFVNPWEARLAPLMERALPQFMEVRRKSPALARDLEDLGLTAQELDSAARCPVLPRMDNLDQALGSVYVLEGATLGGQILAPHFARILDVYAGRGGRYFAGYGSKTRVRWREFCDLLQQHQTDEEGEREMVAASVETFAILAQWLCSEKS